MPEKHVAVVGAVNLDIWGQSFDALIARDSNPGTVRLSLGGVGRNICHNLRLLGAETKFLTAIGDDGWGAQIAQSCRDLGINLDRAIFVPGGRTSSYLCVSGPDGDLALGISDTDIAAHITPQILLENLDFLNSASLVVFDGNLTEQAMEALAQNVTAPLFVDPVSVTKAKKLCGILSKIHTIKPNSLEAEVLTGEKSPERAALALHRAGVRRVFVSDGPNGIFACEGSEVFHTPCFPCKLENATGGGDAAMAALCRAFLDGQNLSQSAKTALAAGAIAVSGEETINPTLSVSAIEKIIKTA